MNEIVYLFLEGAGVVAGVGGGVEKKGCLHNIVFFRFQRLQNYLR